MRFALVTLLSLVVLSGCDAVGQETPTDPATISLSPEAEAAVAQSNGFGVQLFARTVADRDENLMLSPLSASVALTMLLNGSDGETYTQIRDMLGYSADQDLTAINAGYQSLRAQLLDADPQVQLALANAVFYRDSFGPEIQTPFLDAMRTSFDARVDGLDFASSSALNTINGWASDNTNGKIPKVLNELDPALVMLLMNALYFKGDWTTQFDEAATTDRTFTLSDGSPIQVPTMNGDIEARYRKGEGYTAVELPYGRRNFSMIVAVPDAPLADFVDELATGGWADLTEDLGMEDTWNMTTVLLPRFTFENDETLNDPLKALGMVDAFDGSRADLTRIANGLRVDFVKQNTFVEVNEEGTEAAAVTTIGIETTSAPSHPIFVADRPFVFAIRERTTNTLLFIGQVTDPRS